MPETWVPTLTSVTGLSITVSETLCVMSPTVVSCCWQRASGDGARPTSSQW